MAGRLESVLERTELPAYRLGYGRTTRRATDHRYRHCSKNELCGEDRCNNRCGAKITDEGRVKAMVPGGGIEPPRSQGPADFESAASASSAIPAGNANLVSHNSTRLRH